MTVWPEVEAYGRLFGGAPVRFESQPPRPRARRRRAPEGPGYDERICEAGVVPTRRHSWHDLFNALVWVTFPRAKAALHARQLRAQRASGDGARRTREQDALALLDEGGVVMLCAEATLDAVRAALDARDVDAVAARTAAGQTLGVVYGHAVLEHLALEGPAVRALVHPVACDRIPAAAAACVAMADAGLAEALADTITFADAATVRSLPVRAEVLGSR